MTQDVTQTGAPRPEETRDEVESISVLSDQEEDDGTVVDKVESSPDGAVEGDEEVVKAEMDAGDSDDAVFEIAVDEEPTDEEIIAQLREELSAARAAVDENVDKLQRTAAEFQNARRRQERHLSDAIDRANGDLIRTLLPILDDFEMAFQNAPDTETDDDKAPDGNDAAGQAWVLGFRQIQKKLLSILEDEGVTTIDGVGEFNPELHEAVLSEVSDEVESGHIIGVLRTGYEFKGKVLRPAMVRVAA
jgi:molecular chaperone GrpE